MFINQEGLSPRVMKNDAKLIKIYIFRSEAFRIKEFYFNLKEH